MRHLIEFDLEEEGTILVEVKELSPESGVVKAGRAGAMVEKASQTFESALDKIKPAAAVIVSKLRHVADPPDEIEVEFGLTMNADAGAFIAAVSAEANYTITLTWKRGEEKGKDKKAGKET